MALMTVKTYRLQARNVKSKNKVTTQVIINLPSTVLTKGWRKGDIIKVMEDDVNPTVLILKNMSLEERLRRK